MQRFNEWTETIVNYGFQIVVECCSGLFDTGPTLGHWEFLCITFSRAWQRGELLATKTRYLAQNRLAETLQARPDLRAASGTKRQTTWTRSVRLPLHSGTR